METSWVVLVFSPLFALRIYFYMMVYDLRAPTRWTSCSFLECISRLFLPLDSEWDSTDFPIEFKLVVKCPNWPSGISCQDQ